MANEALKERWQQIKIQRFSNLTNIGKLDSIDIWLDEKEPFFNPIVFAKDYIENCNYYKYFTIKVALHLQEDIVLTTSEKGNIFFFSNEYHGFLSKKTLELLFNLFNRYGKYNQIIFVSEHGDLSVDPVDCCMIKQIAFDLNEVIKEMNLETSIAKRYESINVTYTKKMNILYKSSYSDLLKKEEYRRGLIEYFSNFVMNNQSVYTNNESIKNKLITFFSSDKENEYITLLFTANYTKQSINLLKEYNIDSIDFTFASITMYKIIEKTLYQLINTKYSDFIYIYRDNMKVKDLDENKFMLGGMATFLHNQKIIDDNLYYKLDSWIQYDRNGYSHKHILNEEKYYECQSNTYNILIMLVNLLY